MALLRLQTQILKDTLVFSGPAQQEETIRLLDCWFSPFTIYIVIDLTDSADEPASVYSVQIAPQDGSGDYGFFNLLPAERDAPGRRVLVSVSCDQVGEGAYRLVLFRGDRRVAERSFDLSPRGLQVDGVPAPGRDAARAVPALISGTPKSGTTWFETIINAHASALVLHEANFCNLVDRHGYRAPLADKPFIRWKPHAPGAWDYADLVQVAAARELFGLFGAAWPDGVVADRTPGYAARYAALLRGMPELRVIHVLRHPLDVLVSWIFHEMPEAARGTLLPPSLLALARSRRASGTSGCPLLPLRSFIAGELDPLLDIWRREQLDLEQAQRLFPDRLHVVRYEDLLDAFDATVTDAFTFLGLAVNGRQLAHIREATDFKRMSGGRRQGETDDRSFFRNGQAGDHTRFFDQAQIDYCWTRVNDVAARFGYRPGPPA